MNPKSKLFETVSDVLNGEQPAVPFESENLIGRANLLFVKIEKAQNGKEYANVKAILPLPANTPVPAVPQDFVRNKDKQKNNSGCRSSHRRSPSGSGNSASDSRGSSCCRGADSSSCPAGTDSFCSGSCGHPSGTGGYDSGGSGNQSERKVLDTGRGTALSLTSRVRLIIGEWEAGLASSFGGLSRPSGLIPHRSRDFNLRENNENDSRNSFRSGNVVQCSICPGAARRTFKRTFKRTFEWRPTRR